MSLYTNYIEDVYFFFLSSLSLSNPKVYKEVRVLKKCRSSIEKRDEVSLGDFRFSPLCDLCEDKRTCEE